MAFDYVLLLKTGQAEIKAWQKLPAGALSSILPHIELTRGRKIPKKSPSGSPANANSDELRKQPGVYGFEKCTQQVRDIIKRHPKAIIDLTREDSLSCFEIDKLADPRDGYKSWTTYAGDLADGNPDAYPTIIVNPNDDDDYDKYSSDLIRQVNAIYEFAGGACYRASVLSDSEFINDLITIREAVVGSISSGKKFFVTLDHEFIRPKTGILHATRTTEIANKVLQVIPEAKIIVTSTSFPKSITDLGNSDHDTFPIEEIFLFEQVRKNIPSNYSVTYGDYGSINPERMEPMVTNGWVPRIDFPTSTRKTFYYREGRKKVGVNSEGKAQFDSYESHYKSVAKKIVSDKNFENLPESWGVQQINNAAFGEVPGRTPSFWISVRMEIHVQQMLRSTRLLGSSQIT